MSTTNCDAQSICLHGNCHCDGERLLSHSVNSVQPINLRGGHVDGIKFDYIKDNFAKLCEPVQRMPFLWTGRIPLIGMRTETAVIVDGKWARFSGFITNIDLPPTKEEKRKLSAPFSCECRDRSCKFRNGVKRAFGADHGQRIMGVAILNFDFYDKMEGLVDPNRVYEVTYRLDSNRECAWIGTAARRAIGADIDEVRDRIWPYFGRSNACCPPESAPTAGVVAALSCCNRLFRDASPPGSSSSSTCVHWLFSSKEQYQKELNQLIASSKSSRRASVAFWNKVSDPTSAALDQCMECSRALIAQLLNHLDQSDGMVDTSSPCDLFALYFKVEMSCMHFQLARLIFTKTTISHQILMYGLNSETSWTQRFCNFGVNFAVNVYRWTKKDWYHLSKAYKGNCDNIVLGIVCMVAKICGQWWNLYYQHQRQAMRLRYMNDFFIYVWPWFIVLVYAMRRLQYNVTNTNLTDIRSLFNGRKGLRIFNVKIEEDDGIFGWLRSCTIMLFDADKNRNYNYFYKSIKPYKMQHRDTMCRYSKCSNTKCSVAVVDCKYVCAKCRCGIYCSRRCQKYDWNRGDHRFLCKQFES